MLRVRKELIQSRSKVADLQDELEEKTSLYLNAIKQRDQYAEKLRNARDNINNVEKIVGQKVNVATDDVRREMIDVKGQNDTLKLKLQSMDDENKSLRALKTQLQDQINGLQEDLAFYSRNQDVKESINKVNQLRKEKEAAEKKINTLMGEINSLSNVVDDMTAENRQLRRMANVPDNYGIPLETIKLYDKERIEDFKKLIKVLQDDNYKLEEERAKMKHQLKLQAMMYKSNETDPALRYKGLSDEHLQSVDTYVINLLQGNAHEAADFYKLTKENEQLKSKLEMLQNTGFEQIQRQMQEKMANLGGAGSFNGGGTGNLNQDQLNKLMHDNATLQEKVQQLLDRGFTHGGNTVHQNTVAGIDSSRSMIMPGQFRPPHPGEAFDGEISRGISYKFDNSELALYDKSGKHGIRESNVYENAFLQLQLKEAFELNYRQNEQINNQKKDIEELYKKIRGYLLTQDQLYKDCLRVERHYEKKEKTLKEHVRKMEQLNQEEKDKCSKVEAALRAVQTNDQSSMQNKIIELTKQNSLLDLNLLRLTRKYSNLEEQEKMLRREYHAKDADSAEKDRFVQDRINSLKEWKANAMTQLQFLFQKLRIAVPISDLQAKNKQLEIATQRVNDMHHRTGKQAQQIMELQKKLRMNEEAKENIQVVQEEKEALEEEFEIIKKRLEHFDHAFKFENQIYQKIANILKRANVSPLQAFQEFDEDGNGSLDKEEFFTAMDKMRVIDLTDRELKMIWASLDANQSGNVDYREFVRKLEQYGVKNLGRNENILYQLAKAMQRQKIQMSDFFEMIDKHKRGYITREDFKDMFSNLRDSLPNLNERELDDFIENFWRDKSAGIDYKGFLRIFKKYEIKVQQESAAKGQKSRSIVKDDTVRLKKEIFDQIQEALSISGQAIRDLFKIVDTDQSYQLDADELYSMFQGMRLNINRQQTQAIFESIDFDGSDDISLPEFQSDFKNVVNSDLEELLAINRQDNQAQFEAVGNFDAFSMVDTMNLPSSEAKEIQLQNKITRLEAKEKRLQKRLADMFLIHNNSEQSCIQLQRVNGGLERENESMHEKVSQLNERLSVFEANVAHSMPKQDVDDMAQENERLITVYNETRAAMLSYKKMCEVISDQAKNLKLMHERKRDEHENLLEALREMQSEGATKERIGKLYFVIMLSRWQEASVNKKYEAVISEVKDLRTELINSQALVSQREIVIEHNETTIREGSQKIVVLQHEVSKSQGVYMDESKGQELSRINQNLSDELSELENEFFNMRVKFREMENTYDQAKASAEEAQNLSNKLKIEHADEKSRNLIEMSQKLQNDRLKKYQLQRQVQDKDEKLKWLERLNKNKDDAIFKLETKCSKAEGEMHRVKEEYRQLDNERQRKFLRSRFDGNDGPGGRHGGPQGGPQHGATGRGNVGQMLQAAGSMTTGTQRIGDEAAAQGLERIKRAQTATGGDTDWATKEMLEAEKATNKQLQQRLNEMAAQLDQRGAEVGRLRMWQEGDKYLSEDIVLKDAIEDHRLKTLAVAEKEQKEISDAAYQTVKTLQEMIEQKNEQLKRKEENITRLREQMKQQAQLDANTINELREANSVTGNTTMTKLHSIVAKHEAAPQHTGAHTQNATNAFNRKAQEELTRKLAEKDHIIEQLRAGNQGASKEKEVGLKKNADLRNQVEALKEELRREKERVDIKAANKKLLRLQKEKTDQDKVVINLRKAIDEFQKRMLSYESEKVQLQETDTIAQKKVQLNEQTANKDKEVLNNKLRIVDHDRTKLRDELKTTKVALNNKEDEIQKMKEQVDLSKTALQEKLQELNKERREKLRIENNLKRYEEENKIGGDIEGGRISYAQLEERNRELERDNKILEAQKATVVTKNQEFGTFEYIGAAMSLDQGNPQNQPKTVSEVIARMTAWLQKHDRISIGGIFRSLDRGGFGELNERDFARACARMGIQLSSSNLQKLKTVLDHRSTGYLKYGPLVQQLSGIPTKEFLNPAIEKLAELVRTKDYLPEDFKQILDPRQTEQMKFQEFSNAMVGLRSADFEIYDEEISKIFTELTKQPTSSRTAQLKVDELIKEIYDAVKAVMIFMMQNGLKKSRKFLVDLLAARDSNRDGYLEYQEFEDMLLQEMQVPFYPKLFESIVIEQLMDPGKRQNKIKNDVIKMFLGEGEQAGMMTVDMVPSQEGRSGAAAGRGAAGQGAAGGRPQQTQANAVQQKMLQAVSRKVLMGFQGTLGDTLNKEDPQGDGLLPIEKIQSVVDAKRIQALQPSELQFLLTHCDSNNYGFVIISNFHAKLLELAQETEQEVKLRRFAKSIGNQGLNLKAELSQNDRTRKGELDQVQFKRALKQLAVALTDPEIKELFETGLSLSKNGGSGQLEIASFVAKVTEAQRTKPLPAYLNAAAKPGSKVGSRIGQGVRQAQGADGASGSQFENWEIEKKYKRNLEALKHEIEERNKELLLCKKEVQTVNLRVIKLEEDKGKLEQRLIDKNAKPPREMQSDSQHFGNIDEIQKLKDEIFHLQQVNSALQKTMQVGLKAELSKVIHEKELLEDRLKNTSEKLRNKSHECQMLIGQPVDAIGQRENQEESRQQRIEELEADLEEAESRFSVIQEQLFKSEEKNLDLKFEKETFDLQYARLQKRITDLEQYKLQSSAISANLQNARAEELATIKEQTAKVTGEQFSSQGDTVKLRNRKLKSVQELETVIDTLGRVIDKQKVEMDNLRSQNNHMKDKIGDENSAQQAQQLSRKVEVLEQALHSAEMKEVNMDEQERTMKKLIFANKQLREDLSREIERYNLLEDKFRDLLVKYNLTSKENEKNQKLVFTLGTGANLPRYDNFLDEGGDFTSGKKKRGGRGAATYDASGLDDELNRLNREAFDGL